MRRIKSAVPLKLQRKISAAPARFNAANTFCFSQKTHEAKFEHGGNRIFPAYKSLSEKPCPQSTEAQSKFLNDIGKIITQLSE